MTMRSRFVNPATIALAMFSSSYASAGILTVHFPGDLADQVCPFYCFNTTADGFRISINWWLSCLDRRPRDSSVS